MKASIISVTISVVLLLFAGFVFAEEPQEFFPDADWPDQEFNQSSASQPQQQVTEDVIQSPTDQTQDQQGSQTGVSADTQKAAGEKEAGTGPIEEKGWYGQTEDKPWYWQVDGESQATQKSSE